MSLLIHTPKKNTKSIEKRIELMLSTIKMSVPSKEINTENEQKCDFLSFVFSDPLQHLLVLRLC